MKKAHQHDDQLIDDNLVGIPVCCYKECSTDPTWTICRKKRRTILFVCDEHYSSLTSIYQGRGIVYKASPYSGSEEETARIYRESAPLPLNIITGVVVIAVAVVAIPIVVGSLAIKGILSVKNRLG